MTAKQNPLGTRYLTGPQVCQRYQITDMSLWRWLADPKLRFPQPKLRVRKRRLWDPDDLIEWERNQKRQHANKREADDVR